MSLQDLEDAENRHDTRVGAGFLSERAVFRGRDLHHQLSDWSWLKLFVYGITGREFDDQAIALLNYVWVSTSYPDARIWPNQVAALAGSMRSTGPLALTAGMAMSEASLFGGRPFVRGLDCFQRLSAALADGSALEDWLEAEITENGTIFGYGRPIARRDERIPHMLVKLKTMGWEKRPTVVLALRIWRYLESTRGIEMNIAALYCAIGAELEFSVREFQSFMTLCFSAGMAPCYHEALEKPVGCFLPLRCASVHYTGVSARTWE
ncbi:MAG: hypothetical protein HYV16_08250 [Gammaproteobacteria bacterium]|nr:hypothetical protein [Gammaproteobacteria bacterium]